MLPIGAVWQTVLETPLINLMVLLSVLAFGSYGVAILAFTVLTRVVTFPLTLRTLRAARRLQELQPDMEAIQKKHSDPRRRSEEQMKLYRRKTIECERAGVASAVLGHPVECDWKAQDTNRDELMKQYERHLERVHSVRLSDAHGRHVKRARKSIVAGINPLGCLGPQLIQMPIFFALFIVIRTTLSQSPEDVLKLSDRLYDVQLLQSALPLDTGFLGMNLSSNGNLVLVFVIFASMWLTQRISSARSAARAGSQQAQMNQMMQWMLPALFGWFALVVPAGLGLYWAASTLIGLVLQWVFVGPGDFTWGSLIPVPVRERIGMAPLPVRAGAGGGSAASGDEDRDGSDETPEGAAAAEADGEPAQTGEADDGRRGQRKDGRRRRRPGTRPARGQSRSRRRRGDSRR
jgi:YidC/Oxa1 family membrane protein insertase